MRNPFAKLAIAATIVTACLMGLFVWTGGQSGLALADVLEEMERVAVYKLRMTTMYRGEDDREKPVAEAAMLIARDLGQKVTIQLDHPITGKSMLQEIYILPSKQTITTLMPNEKKYSKVELDETSIERWQNESDPRRIVERVLQCEHTRLGRSIIDGVEVEGFQTTDPGCLGETSTTGAEIKIWADMESKLPVRIEIAKSKPGQGHVHIVAEDFEWDITVDATAFEPAIPDDYTPGRPMMQILPNDAERRPR